MWAAIKGFFSGGKVAAIAAAALAISAAVWKAISTAKSAGANEQKLKEKARYEQDVSKAAKADRARDDVLSGRVQPDPHDKYRRD